MARTLDRLVRRLEREVGFSHAAAVRVARKMNDLAKRVDWMTPIPEAPAPVKAMKAKRPAARTPALGKTPGKPSRAGR